ncbi:MAG TPA: hypothetical protein VFB25_08610, partial [Gaiellaceae bacterium]|nr:hypothetical protein [Gaiellaceae bacterium]
AAHVTEGIYADTWAGRTVVFRQFACTGGTLSVTLGSDERLFPGAQEVEAFAGGRLVSSVEVGPSRERIMRVPLVRGQHGACTVRFVVPRTRVPARVEPGNADTRHLGIRFVGFRVS